MNEIFLFYKIRYGQFGGFVRWIEINIGESQKI